MNRAEYGSRPSGNLRLTIILVLGLLFALTILGVTAFSRIEGELVGEFWLAPEETSGLFGPQTNVTWNADYFSGKVEELPGGVSSLLFSPYTRLVETGTAISGRLTQGLTGRESFGLTIDGYYAREFGPEYPIGTMGGSTKLAFGVNELDYLAAKGMVNYGGFTYSGVFHLESSPVEEEKYGAGLEISISGTKISGIAVGAKSRIGMVPNPGELAGLIGGPGYDVFTSGGEEIRGYSGTEISFQGITLGSARFDSTARFNPEKGLDGVGVDFEIEEEQGLFGLNGSVAYSPTSKEVTIRPVLDLGWTCVNLYADIDPVSLNEDTSTISGLTVKGYGVTGLQINGAKISLKNALDGHYLYRKRGYSDYQLRASDYLFPPADLTANYEKTDYQGVLSFQGSKGNLTYAVDSYWTDESGPFAIGLITGETGFRISESFELETGLSLEPERGLENLIFKTIYRW